MELRLCAVTLTPGAGISDYSLNDIVHHSQCNFSKSENNNDPFLRGTNGMRAKVHICELLKEKIKNRNLNVFIVTGESERKTLQAFPLCWKETENVGGFNNILARHNSFRSRFAWIWCPGKRSLLIVSSFLKNNRRCSLMPSKVQANFIK